MAWLTGWGKRKSHVINNATGAGTLYPVKIIVHKGTGSDSGADVYLGTSVRDDFKDVRFTDNDGETVLDCFMESFTSGTVATFWVEVADDLSTAPATIYVYYDKAAETTIVSNAIAANILQLREHYYYTGYAGVVTFSIESSTRVRSASAYAGSMKGWMFLVVPRTWLHGKYLRFNWQGAYSGTLGSDPYRVRVNDGSYLRSSNTDFPTGTDLDVPLKGAGLLQTPDYRTTTFGPVTVDVLMNLAAGNQDFVTIFFRLRDPQSNCSYTEDVDWLEVNTGSGGSGNLLTVHFTTSSVVMELTGTTGDYGLARKYVSPEPAHSTWGPEQTPIAAPTVTTQPATGLGLD
jgi:hypothetical protein